MGSGWLLSRASRAKAPNASQGNSKAKLPNQSKYRGLKKRRMGVW